MRTVATGAFWASTWTTTKMKVTLQLSFLYAVGFGGFVAFSVYLPTYLQNAYALGYVLLAPVAAGAALHTWTAMRSEGR